MVKPPPARPPTDLRRHRALTDRNLLIGFFAVLLIMGGGLIAWIYGATAGAAGILCIAAAVLLVGVVMLIISALSWLSDWLERDEH